MIWIYVVLIALCVFFAWRLSKVVADPDWAVFNLPGLVGSHYGRDFVDCKTPAIHYTNWLITKIFGKTVPRTKFGYHLLVSLMGVAYFAITKDFVGAFVYIVMINSGWLLAFHGNVGAIPAGLIMLAIGSHNPLFAAGFLLLSLLYEPKLIPVALAFIPLFGWVYALYLAIGLGLIGVCLGITRLVNKQLFDWLIESSVLVPMRMLRDRTKDREGWLYKTWLPSFTATAYLYILPWIMVALLSNRSLTFWLPAMVYAISIGTGRVVRANHLLPLVAWIATSGIMPLAAIVMVTVDFISNGFYFGDYFLRNYMALYGRVNEAKEIGEKMAEKEGVLWVNCLDTNIYIYAGKPVPYGMAEVIEASSEANVDRQNKVAELWNADRPRWVVTTDEGQRVVFRPGGYRMYGKSASGLFTVYERP
jgi:hypothetical protein